MEVDVRQRAADRMLLVLLEHRVVRGLLPLDHHVEDRVQPRRAGQRRAELTLPDDDRARMPLAVEDARDQALLPEAPDAPRADLVGSALGDLERDALARHRRTMVAEALLRHPAAVSARCSWARTQGPLDLERQRRTLWDGDGVGGWGRAPGEVPRPPEESGLGASGTMSPVQARPASLLDRGRRSLVARDGVPID